MIHYSCDRCKRLIETEDELRYVLRLEVQATFGDHESTDYSEPDHLLEIDEILERQDDDADPMIDEEVYSRKRFDLCSDCCRAFLRNPLGRATTKPVGFSDN